MRTLLFALAIALFATTLQAAGTGDRCKMGTSDPTYICPGGTLCLQAIGNKYCSNLGKTCGWPGKSGYALGDKKEHNGKEYECFANGFWLALGEKCQLGTTDKKYLCPTGTLCLQAIGNKYCSSLGKVCGWPGKSGYSLGHKKEHKGEEYECFANGFKPATGESGTVTVPGVTAIPTQPQIRTLKTAEKSVAQKVFATSVNLEQVRVTNTVGLDDGRPWTTNTPPLYTVNVGVAAYVSLADDAWSDLLIHELTHVWQGQHGVKFMSNSAYHQTLAVIESGGSEGAYEYTAGKQWAQYNSEQQAKIVEHWFEKGMKESSKLFPYIRDNILSGRPDARTRLDK